MAFLLFLGVSGGLRAGKNDSIVVHATAAPDYVRKRTPAGEIVPETYVFSKGRFLSSDTVDRDLERAPFRDICLAAAVALDTQDYAPSKDPNTADLFILLHWGSTKTFEDPQREFNLEAVNAAGGENFVAGDTGALNMALATQEQSGPEARSAIGNNARLLGYERALNRERSHAMASNDERLMSAELNEERYFIIVQAFDLPLLRKERKWRVLWMTRISIRAPGNSFTAALPALMHAGAELFGRQSDDLQRFGAGKKTGTVKLHELKILGPADDSPPAKPGK